SSYPTSFRHKKGPLDFLCLVTRPSRIDLRISSHENIFSRVPELLKDFGNSYLLSYTSESSCAFIVICVFACAIKNMTDSSVYFKSIDSLLKHAIAMKDQLNAAQGRSTAGPQAKNPPASS
uniref:Uncharacterized protein n=1 Tax=Anas platyrhynchos platyrhynchos TaxID=8840 RepID=A0A493TDT9_ANAPP